LVEQISLGIEIIFLKIASIKIAFRGDMKSFTIACIFAEN